MQPISKWTKRSPSNFRDKRKCRLFFKNAQKLGHPAALSVLQHVKHSAKQKGVLSEIRAVRLTI